MTSRFDHLAQPLLLGKAFRVPRFQVGHILVVGLRHRILRRPRKILLSVEQRRHLKVRSSRVRTHPHPPPPTQPSTSDVSATSSGGTAHLSAVRLGPRDVYDRLVLEFTDLVPGYQIGYRQMPARADGSGDEIPLPGASATVTVALTRATADGWSGDTRTCFEPSTVTAEPRS